MSQQLQITGGAKVRSLEGVITGSTGILGSLPINGSNGIPQLDVNGKILVSQLPNSVMEYLGTWNAATNTPTLVNGTGNAGDVYLCNVAGTVNFGAGPITFGVGDQVIYSGTIWQKASGSTGTVTSVAITETGDALSITGSPITTSGTINIGFAGTSAQYVAGDGTLVTFPTITTEAQRLITEVYNQTGATLTKGTVVYINGGHGNLPTVAKALATSDATSAQTYGVVQTDITNNNNGFVVVIGSLTNLDTQAYANGTQLYLSSTVAGAWTSTKQYAPAHLVYVAIVTRSHPTQGVVEVKIMNGFELDELHDVSAQTPSNNDGLFYNSLNALWEARSLNSVIGYTPVSSTGTTNYIPKFTTSTNIGDSLIYDNGTNIGIGTASPAFKLDVSGTARFTGQLTLGSTITNGTYTYTLPGATGVLALTSDLTSFVTLGTLQTITGTKIYSSLQYFDNNVYIKHGISGSSSGYTTLGASTSGLNINLASGTSNNSLNFASTSASNTYTFPNATGTIALTTDLTSYVPTSRTLTINGTTYDLSADRSWTISGTSQWTTSGSNIYYNTGNVGIGTASPVPPASRNGLVVRGNSNGGEIMLQNTDTTDGSAFGLALVMVNNGGGTNSGNAGILNRNNGHINFATNNSDRMIITATGLVGIGTSSPSNTYQGLTIYGSNPSLSLHTSNASGWVWTEYKNSAGTNNFSMGVNQSIPQFVIKAGAGLDSPNFVMSSAGNVGIGTSSPSANLQISGLSGLPATSGSAQRGAFRIANSSNIAFDFGTVAAGQAWIQVSDVNNYASNFALLLNPNGGNVGIGTTSPTNSLDVVKNAVNSIRVQNTGNNADAYYIAQNTGGSVFFGINATGPYIYTGAALSTQFITNNVERMRITSGGQVVIGSTASLYTNVKLSVKQTAANMAAEIWSNYASDNGTPALTIIKNDNNTTQVFQRFAIDNGNAANGQINGNGASQVAFGTWSDRRLKDNIVELPSQLQNILSLKPCEFDYINGSGHQIGFIAQEMQEVYPDSVSEDTDGFLTITGWSKTEARLVKAIQEMAAQIEELKSLINK